MYVYNIDKLMQDIIWNRYLVFGIVSNISSLPLKEIVCPFPVVDTAFPVVIYAQPVCLSGLLVLIR